SICAESVAPWKALGQLFEFAPGLTLLQIDRALFDKQKVRNVVDCVDFPIRIDDLELKTTWLRVVLQDLRRMFMADSRGKLNVSTFSTNGTLHFPALIVGDDIPAPFGADFSYWAFLDCIQNQ